MRTPRPHGLKTRACNRVAWLLVMAFLLLAAPASSQAGGGRSARVVVSAPITAVRYEVIVDSAATANQVLGVSMTFRVAGPEPVVLSLPAWTPGYYSLVWFARRVVAFAAVSRGRALDWRKLDYQTWRIEPREAGTVRVSFSFLADTLARNSAWATADFAFFNGTNLFLYPVGRGFEWPATVSIRAAPGWRVATGMDAAAPGTYHASNYHDLVDMPFFVGHFDFDSTRVDDSPGRWLRVATYPAGSVVGERRARMYDWLRRIVPAEAAVFGDVPWRTYTVLQVTDPSSSVGGLEHQNSQLDQLDSQSLDSPFLPVLYAHEMYHSWNVKRLRPADMVPYRYDDAQPTPWLWVSEGLTNYYAYLSLLRSGITNPTTFLGDLSDEVNRSTSFDEASVDVSVADASLSFWVTPKDGTERLYYPRGDIIGLLLDIMIRDASDNRRSLDDVMRSLYESTYRSNRRGFTAGDWWGAVSRAAGGRSFSSFDRRYVTGRAPLPLDSILPLAALHLVRDSVREPRFGAVMEPDSFGMRVTAVLPGGAIAAIGLREGDVIETAGDIRTNSSLSIDAFHSRYESTTAATLPIVVRRGGQRLTLPLPVRLVARPRVRLLPLAGTPAKAIRIRNGIMHGRTDP
jgi:predicted metalloprotease with PDZ domain